MPRIHITCGTKLKVSAINAELYCTACDKVVEKKDTYKVGKRFFQVFSPPKDRSSKKRKKGKRGRSLDTLEKGTGGKTDESN